MYLLLYELLTDYNRWKFFHPSFSKTAIQALGPTQPPIQLVPEAISPRVKRPGSEADHSLSSNAEDKNDGTIPIFFNINLFHCV
jgi:hypothetical protein